MESWKYKPLPFLVNGLPLVNRKAFLGNKPKIKNCTIGNILTCLLSGAITTVTEEIADRLAVLSISWKYKTNVRLGQKIMLKIKYI